MSESVQPLVRDLTRDVNRLVDRLRTWTPAAWAARAAAGGTRAERAAALAHELARLGRAAGSTAPAGAQPPPLAPHGLGDQVAVLAGDLIDLLGRTGLEPVLRARLLAEADEAVRAARADLEGAGFGFAGAHLR